jgi:hypothetical protein
MDGFIVDLFVDLRRRNNFLPVLREALGRSSARSDDCRFPDRPI